MKKIILILILISSLSAQDEQRIDVIKTVAPYPQSMFLGSLNTSGFSDILNTQISYLPVSNPASITKFKYPAAGMQVSLGSKIQDAVISDVDLLPANQWMPVSAVLVYPVFGFPFALGFQKRYSEKIDFEEMEITTITEPNGTGETFTPDYSTEVYSYSATSGYSFSRLFSGVDQIHLGIQFSADQIRVIEKIWKMEAKINDYAFSVKGGLVYDLSQLIAFGIIYEKNFEREGHIEYNSDSLLEPYDLESGNNHYISAVNDSKYPYTFKLPDKFLVGFSLNPLHKLHFDFGLKYTIWNQVQSNLNNIFDFSLSSSFYFRNNFGITMGVFSSSYSFKKLDYYTNDRDAVFFNSGVLIPVYDQSITIEVFDSHLFSDKTRRQTILKSGFNFSFN